MNATSSQTSFSSELDMSQLPQSNPAIPPHNPAAESARQSVAIPPGILEGRRAFLRDLPDLLKTNHGDWAAYTKDHRVGCGPSKRELYQKCLDQGLKEGEFVVCSVVPDVPSQADDPVVVG